MADHAYLVIVWASVEKQRTQLISKHEIHPAPDRVDDQ